MNDLEKKPRVLVADAIATAGVAKLAAAADTKVKTDISPAALVEAIGMYDALVVRSRTKVTPEIVAAADHLKVVGRAGVGVDNIDLDACRQSGITVVNSPLAASIAVAELTFALMLSLARNTPRADAAMKKGEWIKKQLKGVELYGKTLGLVALGRIGAAVAERAKAFGMRVLAFDPYITLEQIKARNAESASLEEILQHSDYISIHSPLSDETRHMINAGAIAQMKEGVRLICAARGGVIEEAALLAALETGKVAGAALDVFETEPPGASPLVQHPNLVATPHIGAQTHEAQDRAGEDIADEVLAALRGDELRWRVV